MALRVKIDDESFRALVFGKTVSIKIPEGVVEICLSDFGFARMLEAVHDAECHQIHLKLGLISRSAEEEDDG